VEAQPPPPAPQPKRAKAVPRAASSLAWTGMYALSVALAVLSALVAILAATGAVDRIF